jgi:uncharacterized protein YeaO (DUF488 family)
MTVTPKYAVAIKRVYEPASHADGFRVLVERLWPRGVRKDDAAVDLWLKDVAPSAELRAWYGHVVERWPDFRRRYLSELRKASDDVEILREHLRRGNVTLVYAAHDEEHNSALVLRDFLSGAH